VDEGLLSLITVKASGAILLVDGFIRIKFIVLG
jgi:hypothetical protein